MLKRINCKLVEKDQIDKRDNAAAEYIIGVIQRRLRAMMCDTNLPPSYWQYAMEALINLMNWFPRHGDIISKHSDSPRPMEVLSKGRIDRVECNKNLMWWVKPGTPAILTRRKSAGGKQTLMGGNVTTLTRSVWGIALGSEGHLTLFELMSGQHVKTKSYVLFNLKPGQNGWHFIGFIPPALSKAAIKRKSQEDLPTQQVVQLPYEAAPMEQNEVMDGVQLKGTGGDAQPRVIVLDRAGQVLRREDQSGELVPTQEVIKLPELKDQLDQLSDPENTVGSVDFQKSLLLRDPKAFVGKDCYQHFGEATPEGVYKGAILSHQFFGKGAERAGIFEVKFYQTESNPVFRTEFDDDEIEKYVIDLVDGTKLAECPTGSEQQRVQDYDTYVTADSETFFQVCKRMGLKDNEWKLYYMWILSEFGYGDQTSSHPDKVFFDNPYVRSTKPGREERRNRVDAKTIFPRPAGQSWFQMKLRRNEEANMANEEYLAHHVKENKLRLMAENIRVQGKCDIDSSKGV